MCACACACVYVCVCVCVCVCMYVCVFGCFRCLYVLCMRTSKDIIAQPNEFPRASEELN